MGADEDLAATLRKLEETLLSPEGRASREVVQALIAEDFVEFGSSGNVYRKPEIVRFLAEEADESEAYDRITFDWQVKPLAENVALVTYRVTRRTRGSGETFSSLRSSIWRRANGHWQMLFHQGTALPDRS